MANLPVDVLNIIASYMLDARALYLASSYTYTQMPALEKLFWTSRGDLVYKYWPTKLPAPCDIHKFIKANNLVMVQHMILHDETPDYAANLLYSAVCVSIDITKYLISIFNYSMDDFNALLYYAIIGGQFEVLKYLHSLGPNLEHDNEYLLFGACEVKCVNIIEYLVQNGVNLYGCSASLLYHAAQHSDYGTLDYICRLDHDKKFDYGDALWAACESINYPAIYYFLDHPELFTNGMLGACNVISIHKRQDIYSEWLHTRKKCDRIVCTFCDDDG